VERVNHLWHTACIEELERPLKRLSKFGMRIV
jgi:hypothetical protein